MKLDNVDDCIKWVKLHIPVMIMPTGKTKKILVYPFTSRNAFDVVTKHLGEELYKQLNSK